MDLSQAGYPRIDAKHGSLERLTQQRKGDSMANNDDGEIQPAKVICRVAVSPQPDATKLFEPTNRALDVPSQFSQSAAVFTASLWEEGLNVAAPQLRSITFVVVTTVSLQAVRATARSSDLAGDCRELVNQGYRFTYVVPVGGSKADSDWDALSVGNKMDLAAGFAPIHGAGASFRSRAHRTEMAAVDQETGEIDLLEESQVVEQVFVNAWPNPTAAPETETSPTGHATTTPHLLREKLPGDASLQDKDNSSERLPIIKKRSAPFGMGRMRWQKIANQVPQMIRK
jgi:hypothetical protein